MKMTERLLQINQEDIALLTKALTMLMHLNDDCCSEDAAAYLDLLLQLQDDMSEEALQEKIEQEMVRKYGEA